MGNEPGMNDPMAGGYTIMGPIYLYGWINGYG